MHRISPVMFKVLRRNMKSSPGPVFGPRRSRKIMMKETSVKYEKPRSKGKKAVEYEYTLIGGHNEGTLQIKTRRLPPKRINLSSDMLYTQKKDGRVSIEKWTGKKLPPNWLSSMLEIYEIDGKEPQGELNPVYRYIDHQMVDRCSAKTQKGKRCMKAALPGKNYCYVTHKSPK